ncbi:MAG: peroxiredoxin, partial [Paracoccaceae bacterium]
QPVVPVFYALVLGLGGVLSYIFWYSRLDRADNAVLQAGKNLPKFELEDADGNAVSSQHFHGKKLLMMFYRGNWCPLCVAQIREVAERYRELEARGVNVVMVSPQPHKNTRKLAEKFDVPLQFYVDRGNRAATALQITHTGGIALGISGYGSDTVYPTVIIADEQGKILYCDLTDNYRVRPEPEAFITFLDSGATRAG